MVAFATPVSAQPIDDVAHVSVELDSGWTLESAVVDNELLGFFAWIPESEVTPGNVNLAWLEHVGGGAWVMYGWDDSTSANVVAAIEWYLVDETALTGVNTIWIDNSLRLTDPCGGPVVTGSGEAMPTGITPSDPASPILEGVADDPVTAPQIADILAASGASIAPELTQSLLSNSACNDISELDVILTQAGLMVAAESTISFVDPQDLPTALAVANCGTSLCIPWTWTTWGPWSTWTCTGGPTPTSGPLGGCACRYTNCTRTRSGRTKRRSWDCRIVVIATPTDPQTEPVKVCASAPPQTADCPPQPVANCP